MHAYLDGRDDVRVILVAGPGPLLRLGVVHAEEGLRRVGLVQRLQLLVDLLQLLLRVDAEAEDVAAAHVAALDHQRQPELGLPQSDLALKFCLDHSDKALQL